MFIYIGLKMADSKMLVINGLVLALVLSHLALIEGKGRGGVGRIGRVRPSGGRRVTPIRSQTRMYSRPWFQKPIFIGTLYGLASYKSRRRFRDHPNTEPTICRNFVAPNGTHYGYFICPQWKQKDDFSYCCGPERGQRCCRFADDPGRKAGMIIGIILSFVIGALLIALCCWWCQKRKGKKSSSAGRVLKTTTGNAVPMKSYQPVQTSANNGYNPGQTPYPAAPGETPYPVAPGETPYPVPAGQTPYPVKPGEHDFNPGTGATYGPPDSDTPPPSYPGGDYPAPVYPPATGGPVYPPAYPADGAMYPPAEPPAGYPNAPPDDTYQPPADGPPYPVKSAPYPIK